MWIVMLAGVNVIGRAPLAGLLGRIKLGKIIRAEWRSLTTGSFIRIARTTRPPHLLLPGRRMRSTSGQTNRENGADDKNASSASTRISPDSDESTSDGEYCRAICDLNLLQSNTQAVALAKYREPRKILPLFERQLNVAGIQVDDLDKLNIIHISGTKGKGSTCAFLESLLRGAGFKTGFYNSPHLVKVTERIRLDGRQIGEAKFSKHFRYVHRRLQEASRRERDNVPLPSYFSFLTILAYHIFLEERVDCAIIEVGIGGQFDPTNIVRRPVACGITSVHFDHTNILGDTIESIARSKAGIAKQGVPIYTIDQEHRSALEVIRSKAQQEGCPLLVCKPIDRSLQDDIQLGIRGIVQYENASLACQLGNYFISTRKLKGQQAIMQATEQIIETRLDALPASFKNSLAGCKWPGRCHIIKYPRVEFYLDGAHTKESMENCLQWFLSEAEEGIHKNEILMVNIIGDRNKHDILKPLSVGNHFTKVIFSTNRINPSGDTPKSETFVNMQTSNSDKSMENVVTNAKMWNSIVSKTNSPKGEVKANIADSFESIIKTARQNPDKLHRVLVTGSLHFVGAVLEILPIYDKTLEGV